MSNEIVTENNAVVDGVVATSIGDIEMVNVKVNKSDNKTNERNNETIKALPNVVETVTVSVVSLEREGMESDVSSTTTENKTEEQINVDKYVEQLVIASYFPSLDDRCIAMSHIGIKPEVGINTGALNGDILHEAGMTFLSAIKKEVFDSKPEWEKVWIKEGRMAGARLEDESFEDDGITPQDGRPKLTVEYLRSIGYDIDIS